MKKDDIVRKGYDKIASKYNASRKRFKNETELEFFISLLPKGARILDAGCGAGVPVTKFLVDRVKQPVPMLVMPMSTTSQWLINKVSR